MENFVCVGWRAVSKHCFPKDLPTPCPTKTPGFQAEGFLLHQPRSLGVAAADCRGYRTIRLIGRIQGCACLLFVKV